MVVDMGKFLVLGKMHTLSALAIRVAVTVRGINFTLYNHLHATCI